MAESHLRSFWHVQRKIVEAPVKRVHQMEDSQTIGDIETKENYWKIIKSELGVNDQL